MTPEQLQELKTSTNNKEKFLEILGALLKKRTFMMADLVKAIKDDVIPVSSEFIYELAEKLREGTDGLGKYRLSAFSLYKVADSRGYEKAAIEIAYCYEKKIGIGSIPLERWVSEGIEYAKKVAISDQSGEAQLVLGHLHKLVDKKQALEYYLKIPIDALYYYNGLYEAAFIDKEEKNFTDCLKKLKEIFWHPKKVNDEQLTKQVNETILALTEQIQALFDSDKMAHASTYRKVAEDLVRMGVDPATKLLGDIEAFEGKKQFAIIYYARLKKQDKDYETVRVPLVKLYQDMLQEVLNTPPLPQDSGAFITTKVEGRTWVHVDEKFDGFVDAVDEYRERILPSFKQNLNLYLGATSSIVKDELGLLTARKDHLEEMREKELLSSAEVKEHEELVIYGREREVLLNKHEANAEINLRKLEGFFDPEKRNHKRKLETERTFFNPKRLRPETKKAVGILSEKLLHNRVGSKEQELKAVVYNDQGARRMICAERAIQETAVEVFGYPKEEFETELGYHSATSTTRRNRAGHYYTTHYSYREEVIIFSHVIPYKHRVNPSFNRLGDCVLLSLGDYNKIYETIKLITNEEQQLEMKLACLMLRFSHDGKLINFSDILSLMIPDKSVEELSDAEKKKINDPLSAINDICYLILVKEPSHWWMAKDNKYRDLPLATAQARAMKMLAKGFLTMAQVFKKDCDYGVFTGPNLVTPSGLERMQEKINRIDKSYEMYLQSENYNCYVKFFSQYPAGSIVQTKKAMRTDLQEVYGQPDDSDGEGYDSEFEDVELKQLKLSCK